jgi:selenocysteine lyase/cysteine desulfurase
MDSRRKFLKKAGAAAGALALSPLLTKSEVLEWEEKTNYLAKLDPKKITNDEDFWGWVRESFTVSTNIINLNNGGVSPQPKVVQDAHIRYYQMANEGPSFYMWRVLDQGREPLRAKLAKLAGCDPEEIAINRNATEGLNTIIFGLNLKEGDEVVLSKYDYPNMMNAWKQREKRDKIKLVWVDPILPFDTDEAFVNLYAKAITSKTKIVHITHMINWTGQFVPVKKIADIAHAKGCEVIVDGAHSFGHTEFKIEETGADYFATSLHKWLCAPFGSGFMYIKKDKIKNIWALLSNDKPDGDDIRKFESLGTRSFASEMAISAAIDFHNVIGSKRKEDRLRFIKNYWCEKVKNMKGVSFNTPLNAPYGCAIMNFSVEGWKASEIENHMFKVKKIHTVAIEYEKLNGVRVAPSIYTSLSDLDVLVEAIESVTKAEPPKKS